MEQFDYIIVGGGTAGCILANRLTASSRHRVLLLEAGGAGRGFWVSIPAGFTKLLTDKRFNWVFQTEPEENVHRRTIVVPGGKGLGGSTLINGMIFVRGQPQDYDGWAQLGAKGWSFEGVLPYFKKLENFENGGGPLRGKGGPVNIVRVSERPAIAQAFIAAAGKAGFPENPDYNAETQEGFGYYQVNQRDGRRWSVVDAYLRPAMSRRNLAIRTDAYVAKVDFEGRRAVGVTYRTGGVERRARARAEVILSAGAVQSPQLLELSGVGDPKVLRAVGLPVLHALPGVGDNYMDHFATRMNWRVKRPVTLNEQTRGWRLALAVAQYFLTHKGILSLGTGLAHGFVKTRTEMASPDVQYFFMHASYANAAERILDREPGMTIGVTQLRPQSRGSIHIKSADPLVPPAIRPNFLAAPADQQCFVEGMRIARRIVEQTPMDPFRAYELNPGPGVNTQAEWLDFTRRNAQTIYHPSGTCRMGPANGAVVNERLKVHGLGGIRVVDASVMPSMISANTQAAVMMIAEKAADIILQDAEAGG